MSAEDGGLSDFIQLEEETEFLQLEQESEKATPQVGKASEASRENDDQKSDPPKRISNPSIIMTKRFHSLSLSFIRLLVSVRCGIAGQVQLKI